jgi:Ca2+-binding RTX toxin-like protein
MGGAGNDTLHGLAGNDTLDGGAGIDTMIPAATGSERFTMSRATGGSVGDLVSESQRHRKHRRCTDTVGYSYFEQLHPGGKRRERPHPRTGAANLTGNTLANVLYAGVGNNVLNGSTGIDTVSYAYGVAGTTGVTVSLALTTAQATGGSGSDTLIGIENLTGSPNNDTLTGNSGANVLNGGAGNDTLDGGSGIDTMTGGDGSDTYYVRDVGDLVSETNAVPPPAEPTRSTAP